MPYWNAWGRSTRRPHIGEPGPARRTARPPRRPGFGELRRPVVALVGPDGAGKTTWLHLTVGMLSSGEGEVRVFGRPVRESLERVAFRLFS
ncbi:ATP-binding cassette domain-containing protein [Streptosporangium sp. 'caverna']|uniref:ATP-binding cassette domain-containing protein n=1 Tax=Streptosporangium sp. 'caverna' TaxID=2202249 RepID=UPI000D7E52CA|nr:ATP-binding cassette domain-containing protein [Streptosporangium sp. 'caverna']AWS45316.1 hypothetical protein DKM19_32335 [Streptosporangium sp. 'caverna']